MATETATLERHAYGWGIATTAILPGADLGRDFVLKAGANGLDFEQTVGLDNLVQALTLALTTRLGDDLFNITYGFDGINALADETDPVLMRERIRIAVIRVLQRDSRVRRILDVNVDNDRLAVPTTAAARELHVRVDFETVVGSQVSVDLGKVIPNV